MSEDQTELTPDQLAKAAEGFQHLQEQSGLSVSPDGNLLAGIVALSSAVDTLCNIIAREHPEISPASRTGIEHCRNVVSSTVKLLLGVDVRSDLHGP